MKLSFVTFPTESKGFRRSITTENASCGIYAATYQLCSALVSSAPEWKFSLKDVVLKLLHNMSAIPLSQNRFAVLEPSISVQFIPIALSLMPSLVQLRHVTSEIVVNGAGFDECASDAYGWTLWLQALSHDVPPNMMESRCRVLDVGALVCIMPDWGAQHPAATVRVNVLDCLRQDVQQMLPQEFTISLLPSVLRIFPTTSSFKNSVPVTIIGRGFSSDLGLKVFFKGQFDMRSVVITVVNHTAIVAATPNWGSLIPQQLTNISVFTDKDETLGGWLHPPSFSFTHSIRRLFPLAHSAAGGSTVTVYGLGFAPGRGYTCSFMASGDSKHFMTHSSGEAVAFTVIKCKVPAWGRMFRACRVLLTVTAPAQALSIPADIGSIIELNFQPSVYSLSPTIIQFSRNALAVVNGTGFGASMSLTMRLVSGSIVAVATDACAILSVTNMSCPVPAWGALHPAQVVQVLFDVAAADISTVHLSSNTNIQFLEGVHSLHPTSGTITGGTLIMFTCEGVLNDRSIIVRFADSRGNELFSIPVIATNSGSFTSASPNWKFTYPSSTAFTADVSVSLFPALNYVNNWL
jgi:hypothetical protein